MFAATLVIPCFEEHERLPQFLPLLLQQLSEGGFEGEVLVVDDGSRPPSAQSLRLFLDQQRQTYPELLGPLLRQEQNQGKGASIVYGWSKASAQSQWLGFVDADGSASATEVWRSYQEIQKLCADELCALFGQRGNGNQQQLKRSAWRRVSGLLFSLMVRVRHQTKLRDSQCGLKWISRASWVCFGDKLQERGFRFDLELIKYLQHHQGQIHTLPISWIEAANSKISPLRAAQIFYRALIKPISVQAKR